ncbi:hypothetical protein COM54_15515 [Bacillus toyonensis]|uniref:hypothetical protein n=1 Tax=Bacillus toyonensis TaxID=155322 RepID=UPI000BF6C57A|nr:hypothetical protein [Bacillus toyonensis]PGE10199.1 hypothetical protein COM54_15515 [Bacillus toyonensis]
MHEFDVHTVFNGILESQTISSEFLINYLARNKSNIIEIFQRNGSNKLRILIKAFGDLESIYNAAEEEILKQISGGYKDSLIIFTISLSFAVKSNGIPPSIFELRISSDDFDNKIIVEKMVQRHKKAE